jgi:hypothetical protein
MNCMLHTASWQLSGCEVHAFANNAPAACQRTQLHAVDCWLPSMPASQQSSQPGRRTSTGIAPYGRCARHNLAAVTVAETVRPAAVG